MRNLKELTKLIRYYILLSTTEAGSGHPTSSLSSVELMTALFFGGIFRFDLKNPSYCNNDRVIFSKGHATPLLYALYGAAGILKEEDIRTYRKFDSPLEGHPKPVFPYIEAATGSLGQGLSVGIGMAISAKYIDKLPFKTYVLLGDSEMTEGSVWEAIQIAAHYKLDNLIGIIDVNRLGQTGQTMYGHDILAYKKRVSSFGWETIMVDDGHSISRVFSAFKKAQRTKNRPTMIITKTIKGKGISFLENQNGWHGKALSAEEFRRALAELGPIDKNIAGQISNPAPAEISNFQFPISNQILKYETNKPMATRKAYGNALARIFPKFPEMVVLDAEVSNSTYSEIFKEKYPERFFEMYIAEQNMVGAALGFSCRGKIPFVSTFAAFFTRALDQIRMAQYSLANIKFAGSHAGVSIGQDGPSQMGLEDIALFRAILDSVVLYPSDAVSTEKLTEEAAKHKGMVYIRTTRKDTPIIYNETEEFHLGGSKTLRSGNSDIAAVVAAGITLHEALAAYEILAKENIFIRVIDLYSIKPIDKAVLQKASKETGAIIVVEDHFCEGGIAEAVRTALEGMNTRIISLAVRKIPKSGKPEELLNFEEISKEAIINKVKELHETAKS